MKDQNIILNTRKEVQNLFSKYKSLHEEVALPFKVKLFYSLLEDVYIKNTSSSLLKSQAKRYKLLLSAYKKQSDDEKIKFLYQNLKSVKDLINKDKEATSTSEDTLDFIKEIETTCKVKEAFFGLTKWTKKSFKLSIRNHRIRLSENKKEIVIEIPYYFIRKSAKYSNTFILESISDAVSEEKSEFYVSFDNSAVFEEIFNLTFSCVIECNSKELMKLCYEKEDDSTCNSNEDIFKGSTILTQKVLNEFLEYKEKIIRKLENSQYKFDNIGVNLSNTVIGLCRDRKKDRIKIERNMKVSMKELEQKAIIFNREKDERLIDFEVLESFSSAINVVYFKYSFKSQNFEFLTILEEVEKKGEKVLTFKGIDNLINEQFIDFLTIRLKEKPNGEVSLSLMGIVKSEHENKNEATEFLLSLIETKEIMQTIALTQEDFYTVKGMESIEMDNVTMIFENDEKKIDERPTEEEIDEESFEERLLTYENTLKTSHFSKPFAKEKGNFLKEHPLSKEWKMSQNGGFICTNTEQINEQKKVFKYVISKIGSNIVSMKNILNVSLPVTIFRPESHLQSVARNFSYAPIFLENLENANAEMRVKKAMMFQISMASLVISMNKPFNPILGETYQGLIDGCPIFLEQISHHPPICGFLFIGRGYKIYGTVEAKIALGLNSAKGWSPPFNYIVFDDGQIIEFTMNKLVIGGMLFGERTFNFEGTNYVIDKKNKLYADIHYGNECLTVYKRKQLAADSVSGAIYNLNELSKIYHESFKREERLRVSSFIGTWHSEITMDGEKVFDFKNDLPYEFADYSSPLASDSQNRRDVIELKNGNVGESQIQKEWYEEMQRRDKSLRENAKKSK